MTNEEAKLTIDCLKEMQEGYIEGEGYERHPLPEWYALDIAIKAIEQTTWIPISERLPEDGIPCICTVYNTDVYKDNIQVYDYYLMYAEDTEQWSDDNMELCPYDVLAWMPSPEPYKGEKYTEPRNDMDKTTIDACKGAIELLEQQPCERFEWGIDGNVYKITKAKDGKEICQKVCDDAISREDALNGVDAMYNNSWDLRDFRQNVDLMLKELPPVTPQQKYGKWIDYSDEGFVECPFCGHATNCEDNINELHYCFHCGAKMQESEEIGEIHCNHTETEIAKSFIEDVEAVKELLPKAGSEDKTE